MKSREELKKQHEELLQVLAKVKDQLSKYPNVKEVGIGMKEVDGKRTDEPCIIIEVTEKKNEDDLDPDGVIPKEIEGVKTDVTVYDEMLHLAVCASDEKSYSQIKGGIRISNGRNGSGVGGSGTLGCLAQLNSDNSWVLLSNHHVLYGDNGEDDDEIGQPWVGCSWCCKTNVIAKNIDKDEGLDCAIAKINDDVSIQNLIEEIGDIQNSGSNSPVLNERVRKRGARTGYTSGTIGAIIGNRVVVDPNPSGGPSDNPGGCTNYEPGVTVFSNPGDSGSVYLNDDNEVVALHYAGDKNSNKSFGRDIGPVLTALGITIKTTSSEPGTPESFKEYNLDQEQIIATNDGLIEYLDTRLEESETGRRIKSIIERHQGEVLHLVNHHRPVTATWHRKQGPAYIAAFARSIKHPEFKVPKEINKVSLQNLLMSMATVLEEHGSEALQEDIRAYALDVMNMSRNCNTAEEIIQVISTLDDTETVESVRRPIPK